MASSHPRFPLVLSIAAALVTMAMKSLAYWLTGSVGLLSDALESLVNLVAAATALLCIWFASRPVDSSHTYGHEKAEYFSSGLEGMLILVAAGSIAWYAFLRLIQPQPLEELGPALAVSLAAALINFGVAQILLRAGRRTHSIVLEADGQHLMTDVWTSIGVVAGLGVVGFTGWLALDPIIALAVAANITWTSFGLIVRSFHGLMDHSLPKSEQDIIRTAIGKSLPPGVTFHAVRTRQAGVRRFVDFHLLVPGAWSVRKAHDLSGAVEQAVSQVLPGIEVTIHIEPIEEKASWEDSALLPIEREQAVEK